MAQNSFDDQQVNEILARAGQLEVDAEGQLDRTSYDMLVASAEEAGIEPAMVEQAVKQMEAEWRARRAAKRQKEALLRNGGIVVVVVIFLVLGGGAMKRSSAVRLQQQQVQQLAVLKADVDKAAAQLENVVSRADALKAGASPNDKLMHDDLVGSLNRIATERKRYNEAVTTYNNLARTVGDPSYPELPLSK